MKGKILTVCMAACGIYFSGVLLTVDAQDSRDVEIEEYVRQLFIHGVPYEEASRYSADDAAEVLELLNDREEESYWANVVIVASMAGDERVVDPIIEFIEAGQRGEINQAQYNAKTSAIMSLGYVIYHTESREALDYLIQALEPEVWEDRRIQWRSAIHDEIDDLYLQLSTMAVLGLGLSGNSEAADALRSLQERSNSRLGERFREQLNGTLEEALEANQKIADAGMAEYYRESETAWRERQQ